MKHHIIPILSRKTGIKSIQAGYEDIYGELDCDIPTLISQFKFLSTEKYEKMEKRLFESIDHERIPHFDKFKIILYFVESCKKEFGEYHDMETQ